MTIIKKMAAWLICAAVLCTFFALRYDPSDRRYFIGDDLIVIKLVELARDQGMWQPDWSAAGHTIQVSEQLQQRAEEERQRLNVGYDKHYNFAAHISLSAVIASTVKQLGIEINTTVLLHTIALFWDFCSFLLLTYLAILIAGKRAALTTALCYALLPLAVQSSHYARPDTLLGFQAVLVLFCAYCMLRPQNSRGFYSISVLTGLLIGAATATKASGIIYGIFPMALFSYLLVSGQQSFKTLLLAGSGLLLACVSCMTLYFVAVDIDWQDFIGSVQSIQKYYQQPLPPDIRYNPSYLGHALHFSHYLLATLGPTWLSLCMVATATLCCRQLKLAVLLVVPTSIITAYFLSQTVFFDRSFIAIMPIMCLLAAIGVNTILSHVPHHFKLLANILLLTALLMPAAQLSWRLQSHIGNTISDTRKSYQQQLLNQYSSDTGVALWLKPVDRLDSFRNALPLLKNPHPRLYIVEHFNDPQSDRYLEFLRAEGFLQVGYYRGDFAALPTNSLHIAHEAAHFYYFINPAAISAFKQNTPDALSK